MRVLVQRVSQASVTVGGRSVGAIGPGLLLFVGFTHSDDDAALAWMADKVCGSADFSRRREQDESVGAGRRTAGCSSSPSSRSMATRRKGNGRASSTPRGPEQAVPLYDSFVAMLRQRTPLVETGEFGAHMLVSLVNDGPVTLWLER